MTQLLVLKSSIMGAQSLSNGLIDAYLSQRRKTGCVDTVVENDLTAIDLPVLDDEIFFALRHGAMETDRARQAIDLSDRFISELRACDLLVIGAPMYNLNVPTQLKGWFDMVARAGNTFRYTDGFPKGLIENVRAIIISPRGGVHVDQDTDAVTPYLRSVLRLIGITDIQFIYAENMDVRPHGREQGLDIARASLARLDA